MALVELLIETDIGARTCTRTICTALRKTSELASDPVYRFWVFVLLETAKQGGDPNYLLAGFDLAREFDERYDFVPSHRGGEVPGEAIRDVTEHSAGQHLALHLWDACGRLDGLAKVILEGQWDQFPPSSAQEHLYLLTSPVLDTHLDLDLRLARWTVLRGQANKLAEFVKATPMRYQEKALRHLKRITWFWDRPDFLAWALEEFLNLLPRICRPPFPTSGNGEGALAVLTNFEDADWGRLRAAPDGVLRKIEAACYRRNDADLISSGLHFLSGEASGITAEGIVSETSRVLKAAKTLGGLGRSLRREALAAWRAHPLLGEGLQELTAESLIMRVTNGAPPGVAAPVPRKLRRYIRGELQLTPGQVAAGRDAVLRAVPGLRWALLEHLGLERVASTLQARERNPKVRHAVRFYGNVDDNRRALRRFLRAYFRGSRNYLQRHPLNETWLRRQKQLDRRVWLEGMRLAGRIKDGIPVDLHIELDPLEALRLGTYVGSCTGLGGDFAYSAAAVVLDVNKHVVYARNSEGKVVGRQLIAIAAEELLVCFDVYPTSAPAELRRLFRDFDVAFARKLGIKIHRPGSDVYVTVEKLLSTDWWDDGAWDLGVDEEDESDDAS